MLALHLIEHVVNRTNHKWDFKNIAVNLLGVLILISAGNFVMYLAEKNLPYSIVRRSPVENKYLYIFCVLFLNDFLYYWYHRLQHRWGPLWGIHQFHHTDPDMSIMTSHRTHFLERVIQLCFIGFPVFYFMGYNQSAWKPMMYTFLFLLMYTHLRLNISHGPLTKLLVSPSHHRVHHSIDPRLYHSNYAQYFPIFDLLFGTYKYPIKHFNPTGVKEVQTIQSQLKTMIWPFAGKVKHE